MSKFLTGLLARFLFVLPVCWLLFHVGSAAIGCLALKLNATDCFEHLLVMPGLSLFLPPSNTPYLLIVLAALTVAGTWTASARIARRPQSSND